MDPAISIPQIIHPHEPHTEARRISVIISNSSGDCTSLPSNRAESMTQKNGIQNAWRENQSDFNNFQMTFYQGKRRMRSSLVHFTFPVTSQPCTLRNKNPSLNTWHPSSFSDRNTKNRKKSHKRCISVTPDIGWYYTCSVPNWQGLKNTIISRAVHKFCRSYEGKAVAVMRRWKQDLSDGGPSGLHFA